MATPDDRRTQASTLITGASAGIGYELAKVCARHGHNLVLIARSEDRLRGLAGDIQSAYGVSVQVIAKDLARPGAAAEIAAELQRAGTRIDHLVNNAGMDVYGYFSETEWQHELDMIQLNLVSVTHLTKILLPDMRKHGFGRILNLGSTGSFAPSPLNTVYSATKAYIWSFSTALAEELRGSGITVTAYCPGAVRTEFQSRANIRDIRLLRFGVMDAARAAEGGYRAMSAGKRVVIPGLYNKAQVLFARLFPVSLVARMAKAMLEPLS